MCASGCCKELVEVNLCGLEDAVWLLGSIGYMWATGGYVGLVKACNMYLEEAALCIQVHGGQWRLLHMG